ncbi:MAG: cupin domain-containing protein, partial [Gammaproteobacteria bacterium]|nr:cupin domain-containing protein [Gammaproteobacteria bacterium]
MLINNIDINDFLNNYWQKKPLLIRAAFPDYESPVSA